MTKFWTTEKNQKFCQANENVDTKIRNNLPRPLIYFEISGFQRLTSIYHNDNNMKKFHKLDKLNVGELKIETFNLKVLNELGNQCPTSIGSIRLNFNFLLTHWKFLMFSTTISNNMSPHPGNGCYLKVESLWNSISEHHGTVARV